MSGLSDLELVAQAMAPTNVPGQQGQDDADKALLPAAQPTSTSANPSKPLDSLQRPPASDPLDKPRANGSNGPESEEWESLAELKKINELLKLSEGEEDLDDGQIAELLQQMDAAGLVADDIEGKLDALLANLGSVEEEMQAGLEEAVKREEQKK
jgi:hypothetical protein